MEIQLKYKAKIISVSHQEASISLKTSPSTPPRRLDSQLDADEVVSPELAKEIISVIKTLNTTDFG